MNSGRKRNIKPSLRKVLLAVLAVLVPIVAVGIGFIAYSVQNTQAKERARFQDSVTGQIQEAGETLTHMNYYLIDVLLNSPHIKAMQEATDVNSRNVAARALVASIGTEARPWTENFSFYFQPSEQEISLRVFNPSFSIFDNQALQEIAQTIAGAGQEAVNSLNWTCEVVNGTPYLYQVYRAEGNTLAAWTACDTLFGSIRANSLSPEALITYLDMEGRPLLGEAQLEQYGVRIQNGAPQLASRGAIAVLSSPPRTGLQVLVADTPYIDWGGAFLLLGLLLLILCIVLAVAVYVLRYFRRHIEEPLAQFQNHINEYAINRESAKKAGFQELNEAVSAFDSLAGQLEELRIDLYEEKLAVARTELEYYQLQIKPHFFVNCFSLLHAMAQKKEYARIQQFCIKLSNYVRYLLTNSMSLVPLREELFVLREYLDIQRIRHKVNATLLDSVDSSLQEIKIPPLSILTFAENSARHGAPGEGEITIEVDIRTVEREAGARLQIVVRDNGVGFPPQFLEMYSAPDEQEDLHAGSHLGVRNILMRLYLLYGENHSLHFHNPPGGGSQVTVEIPPEEAR